MVGTEKAEVFHDGPGVSGEYFKRHMAEYVTRGGRTVQEHAFESGGNAVKKTVSSASDLDAVDVDRVGDTVAAESLQLLRDFVRLCDPEVRCQNGRVFSRA